MLERKNQGSVLANLGVAGHPPQNDFDAQSGDKNKRQRSATVARNSLVHLHDHKPSAYIHKFSARTFAPIAILIFAFNRHLKSEMELDATSVVAFIATTLLAFAGLSPSPDAVGIVGLLVAVQLYPRFSSKRAGGLVSPCAASTLGATISHVRAASNALQTSTLSILLLVAISAVMSFVSVGSVFIDACRIGKNRRYNWTRLAGFPALWASICGLTSVLNPVGRLLVWSPVTGLGPYAWVSSCLGPWGIDFILAAWSVAITEVIAVPLSQYALLVGDPEGLGSVERLTPYTDNPSEPTTQDHSAIRHKSAFAAFLLALTLPSLWTSEIPNIIYTPTSTPFTLGCVLPQTHLPHKTPHPPTLDDYITETRKMTNAKLLLWPEGVFRFDTEADRNATFEMIADKVLNGHKGLHIGVGFEEDAPESWNQRAKKRNGFALLTEDRVVLQYYKRSLVPSMLIFYFMTTGPKLISMP